MTIQRYLMIVSLAIGIALFSFVLGRVSVTCYGKTEVTEDFAYNDVLELNRKGVETWAKIRMLDSIESGESLRTFLDFQLNEMAAVIEDMELRLSLPEYERYRALLSEDSAEYRKFIREREMVSEQ